MARPKKDGVSINLYIDRQLLERLKEYCAETGQNRTLAVERMVGQKLSEYFEKPVGKRVSF